MSALPSEQPHRNKKRRRSQKIDVCKQTRQQHGEKTLQSRCLPMDRRRSGVVTPDYTRLQNIKQANATGRSDMVAAAAVVVVVVLFLLLDCAVRMSMIA